MDVRESADSTTVTRALRPPSRARPEDATRIAQVYDFKDQGDHEVFLEYFAEPVAEPVFCFYFPGILASFNEIPEIHAILKLLQFGYFES
ncbi:hypothetical protein Y032_0180g810 [Ancylostoma ceylanicum]|uniref:Uncharacterized protein n=1 Tax=Ancylostoma ceylanicum TaxID=53326 RepID=A0A016STK5_9BILA|nr:hypothetical protein Y032_0180g810 [Ancylostoma ceylanicum]